MSAEGVAKCIKISNFILCILSIIAFLFFNVLSFKYKPYNEPNYKEFKKNWESSPIKSISPLKNTKESSLKQQVKIKYRNDVILNDRKEKKGQSCKSNFVKIHKLDSNTKNKVRNKIRYMTSKSENYYFENFQNKVDDIIKSSLEIKSISESDDIPMNS